MNEFTQRDLNLLLRTDILTFARKAFKTLNPTTELDLSWHHDALFYLLERCMKGEVNRVLITIPPRSLKSFITSVCLPAFLMGNRPETKIICASYSQLLADEFSNQCRTLMSEDWYKQAFQRTRLSPVKNTASVFDTTMHGKRIATSPGGTLTGFGGDFIIIDDINKASDMSSESSRESTNQWFDHTLQSRLNDIKKGCIIVVQQRIHIDDLAGHILNKDGWHHLNLPAISQKDQIIQISDNESYSFNQGELLQASRLDQASLDQKKRDVGSMVFSAQYLQTPVPEAGNIIPIQNFRTFDVAPIKQTGDIVVNSWDTASGTNANNDYSVGTVWLIRDNQYFLLNVVRRKMSYAKLKAEVLTQGKETHADIVVIEKAGVGFALIDELRRVSNLSIVEFIPTGNKVDRMLPSTADIEAGLVGLPKVALWRADFEAECAAFPKSDHDDQVDSMSMFLWWAREHRGKRLDTQQYLDALDALAQPDINNEDCKTKEDVKKLLLNLDWRNNYDK